MFSRSLSLSARAFLRFSLAGFTLASDRDSVSGRLTYRRPNRLASAMPFPTAGHEEEVFVLVT